MLKFVSGDLFTSEAEALVNTVNTVGVMGKGVALQFKERYQENYKLYVQAAKKSEIKIGKMFVTATHRMEPPYWIINFPTKKNWIHASSYEYIESGLVDLVKVLTSLKVRSVAIPPLGSGHGGLDWNKVKAQIVEKLSDLNLEILVYEPGASQAIKPTLSLPELTKARALVLSLANKYQILGYELSLLEIQKLAYFLQRVGQKSLNLNFQKFHYGPYAHNLQHLLHKLEGYYLISDQSIFDSKPLDTLRLNANKISEVTEYINKHSTQEDQNHLRIVENIMHGFESPFGLELLATVDWILLENTGKGDMSVDEIRTNLIAWSKRKDFSFTNQHLKIAVEHLTKFRDQLYPAKENFV